MDWEAALWRACIPSLNTQNMKHKFILSHVSMKRVSVLSNVFRYMVVLQIAEHLQKKHQKKERTKTLTVKEANETKLYKVKK